MNSSAVLSGYFFIFASMLDAVFLIIGFILLFASGRYLVLGGVHLAKLFNVPTLVVGLTIVSFGTSAPELLVSLKAALANHPDIAIGNVVGSNISNIALVLGITALITPLAVAKSLVKYDWPVLMLSSILLLVFAYLGVLLWWHAVLLLVVLVGFNISSVWRGRKQEVAADDEVDKPMKWYWSTCIVAASSFGLLLGAEWLVKGATGIATGLGVSERIISVSIIAFGTRVPELVTSIVAALKKEADISIGNIVGSNIFNIAGILGITGLVTPIAIDHKYLSDIFWMLGITLILLLVMLGKKRMITRFKGLVLILAYSSYLFILLS